VSSSNTSNISDEMRGVIGATLGRRVSYPVSESDIRRWAVAVYWPEQPPRRFWDSEYAKSTQRGGIVAPDEFNPFAWMVKEKNEPEVRLEANDPDRTEKTLGVTGPGLQFQLNGGVEVEYGVPVRPGDVITAVSTLDDYVERESRLGLMLITTMLDTWTNQDGEVVKRSRTTLLRY
jgi:hypothetical protein